MSEQEVVDERFKVFISYSRDDLEFVDQLEAILTVAGYDTLIDRDDIAAGEAWQPRLTAMLTEAETVVCVTSPSSIASEVCTWEVEEAKRLGKRLIPVIYKPLPSGAAPPAALAALNYIFFYAEPRKSGTGYGRGVNDLARALDTDLDWLREHTRYLQRATEWDEGARAANRLLVGGDIDLAKSWLVSQPKGAPDPLGLHLEFIQASELESKAQAEAEIRRLEEKAALVAEREKALVDEQAALEEKRIAQQREAEASRRAVRRTRIGAGIAVVLAVLAIGAAMYAEHLRVIAEREERRATAGLIASASQRQLAAGDSTRALRLAEAASSLVPGENFAPVDRALVDAYAHVHEAEVALYESRLVHDHEVTHVEYSADGTQILTTSRDGHARLWDTRGRLQAAMAHESDRGPLKVVHGTFHPTDDRVFSVGYGAMVRAWTLEGNDAGAFDGHGEHPVHKFDNVNHVAVSPDGERVVTVSADQLVILRDAQGQAIRTLEQHRPYGGYPRHVAFAANGSRFATTGWDFDRTVQLYDRDGTHLATLDDEAEGSCTYLDYECGIARVAFDPMGEFLVTASADGSVRWYDLDGKFRFTRSKDKPGEGKDRPARVLALAISPDGQHVATGSDDGEIALWARDGEWLRTIPAHRERIHAVAFSPDGDHLATASSDRTARLWSLEGEDIAVLEGHVGSVETLSFSPDGERLITGSTDKTAIIWNLEHPRAARFEHERQIVAAEFVPPDDAMVVTASQDMTVRLWEASTGRAIESHAAFGLDDAGPVFEGRDPSTHYVRGPRGDLGLKKLDARMNSLAVSPDGLRYAAVATDYLVHVFETKTGDVEAFGPEPWQLACTNDQWCGPRAVAFTPDGEGLIVSDFEGGIVTLGPDGEIDVQIPSARADNPSGHEKEISALAVHADRNLLASGSHDRTIRLWNLETGEHVGVLAGHTDIVRSVAFSRDGTELISASEDHTIRVWQIETGEHDVIRGHDGQVLSAAFAPEGEGIVSVSSDGTARRWDRTGKPLSVLHVSDQPVTALSRTANEAGFLIGSANGIALEWPSPKAARTWLAGTDDIYALGAEDYRALNVPRPEPPDADESTQRPTETTTRPESDKEMQ